MCESLDHICAERLTPSLVKTAKHVATLGVLVLTAEVESQLATISLIGVATGWSERVMVLGRSYQAMREAFEQVSMLLFPLLCSRLDV